MKLCREAPGRARGLGLIKNIIACRLFVAILAT